MLKNGPLVFEDYSCSTPHTDNPHDNARARRDRPRQRVNECSQVTLTSTAWVSQRQVTEAVVFVGKRRQDVQKQML